MRRVVVTGMGIVSCLGNSTDAVLESLKAGKSGIRFNETYRDMGFRSQVAGSVDVDTSVIDRKTRRFMGQSAMYSYLAMEQAIASSRLTDDLVSNDRTGLIAGSGGASSAGHRVQNSRCELLHVVCLRHQRPLYWPRRGADPVRQAGHRIRRRW